MVIKITKKKNKIYRDYRKTFINIIITLNFINI